MAPRMSAARKLFQDSPVSFKQQPKNEMARSSTPYRICSSRKAKKLLSKPTLHRAKLNETDASRLSTTKNPYFRVLHGIVLQRSCLECLATPATTLDAVYDSRFRKFGLRRITDTGTAPGF